MGLSVMNYSELTETIIKKVMAAVALINNPEIIPEIRQLNQEILFREVGNAVYAKVYDMNAFDFEIEYTRGTGIDDRYYGLAKHASYSVSAGSQGLEEYVTTYINNMAGKAQQDAFRNAKQSGKFPTVSRQIRGETCKWCSTLAGEYTNPGPDVFKRHSACDCAIITKGYKSRNGLLKNYVQPKDR